jgi:hypothetical protein
VGQPGSSLRRSLTTHTKPLKNITAYAARKPKKLMRNHQAHRQMGARQGATQNHQRRQADEQRKTDRTQESEHRVWWHRPFGTPMPMNYCIGWTVFIHTRHGTGRQTDPRHRWSQLSKLFSHNAKQQRVVRFWGRIPGCITLFSHTQCGPDRDGARQDSQTRYAMLITHAPSGLSSKEFKLIIRLAWVLAPANLKPVLRANALWFALCKSTEIRCLSRWATSS